MGILKSERLLAGIFLLIFLGVAVTGARAEGRPAWMEDSMKRLAEELVETHGADQKERLDRGMRQVADLWREEDGGSAEFEAFVRENFAGDETTLKAVFDRSQRILEHISGAMHGLGIELRRQSDLALGPILPVDRTFSAWDPGAHVADDLFANKVAFVILLNFPLTTLEQRLTEGREWSREEWAMARLAQRFSRRVPAEVNQVMAEAQAATDAYIADYNIWMHHLVDESGERLFQPGLRLLSHWNLRDELKADYADGETGYEKQKTIFRVMERIVDQTIPEIVIDSPHVDWNPFTNEVTATTVNDSGEEIPGGLVITAEREPDTRYEMLLGCFRASQRLDEYSPSAPTLIARRFEENREIREKDVERMLVDICSSPLAGEVAAIIEKRLGRPLEPWDIWYNGFRSKGKYNETELDRIVREKYPDPEAFEDDIPRFLAEFGFREDRIDEIAANIVVEPARGSGHASGGEMRFQPARLRTRVGPAGMDYKGFNIAVHELGHNVEQTITMNYIDHTLLGGVPNTAFTEAFAFVFQENDLMLLGLDPERDPASDALDVLSDFWDVYEISGVSLVDMRIWRWMYDNPDADAARLRDAVLDISRDVWNEFYAPVFGVKDIYVLGIYSHIIHSFLYVPDYAIGHMIAFQVKKQMKEAGNIGLEFERMALAGNIAPDLWMERAAGTPVGADAILQATAAAIKDLQ